MKTERAEPDTAGVIDAIQHFIDERELDEHFLTVVGQLDNTNDPEDESEQYNIEYTLIPGNNSGKKYVIELTYENWADAHNQYRDQVETIKDEFKDARKLLSDPEIYTDAGIGGGNPRL